MDQARETQSNTVMVWDPLVRIFHWSLVIGFAVAHLGGEIEVLLLHAWAGYLVGGLILFRLLWGIIGTRHARFSDFLFSPTTVRAYSVDLLRGQAKRYLGHNLHGAMMVFALLFMLAASTLTGLAVYATEEGAGPLAGLLRATPPWLSEALEELHEFLSHFTLLLVGLHITCVVVSSVLHRENLVRAMITGRKRA